MVDYIDLHALTLEELTGVVNVYPWFGAARKLLCERMMEMGALSDTLLSQTALYIGDRSILYYMVNGRAAKDPAVDYERARKLEQERKQAREASAPEASREARRNYVAGGDYFSQSQYNSVRKSGDDEFARFAVSNRAESARESGDWSTDEELYTETLAGIYVEQGYLAEAKKIYSKLSLRYPEKSVYFANLIDEINKN